MYVGAALPLTGRTDRLHILQTLVLFNRAQGFIESRIATTGKAPAKYVRMLRNCMSF